MEKVKYATNKELLREIHNSKKTFCYFEDKKYEDYDVIVGNIEAIDQPLIDAVLAKKNKNKTGQTFDRNSIVFRVMTHEHIPIDPDRKRKARNTDKSYARTNFPPFKHYAYVDNKLTEVGRSHWDGDLQTGHFSLIKGRMNNTLATIFMLLVERYSKKGNWRGYSYVDEMRSHALLHLAQVGLQFDESKSDNPFAFYTQTVAHCFTRVLNLERRSQNIRDDIIIMAGQSPSVTRQIENELAGKFPDQPVLKKIKRRGAESKTTFNNDD